MSDDTTQIVLAYNPDKLISAAMVRALDVWPTPMPTSPREMSDRLLLEMLAERLKLALAALVGMRGALESIFIGGNHLAHQLVKLQKRFPLYSADTDKARAFFDEIGRPEMLDVWICWQRIMLARDATANLKQESAANG